MDQQSSEVSGKHVGGGRPRARGHRTRALARADEVRNGGVSGSPPKSPIGPMTSRTASEASVGGASATKLMIIDVRWRGADIRVSRLPSLPVALAPIRFFYFDGLSTSPPYHTYHVYRFAP